MNKFKNLVIAYILIAISTIFFSCLEASNSDKVNILRIPENGYNFSVKQRQQAELPSSAGGVVINVDDITRGKAKISVIGNQKVLLDKYVSEGDENLFELDGTHYKLVCRDIDNKIVGEDSMDFFITLDNELPFGDDGKPSSARNDTYEKINDVLDRMESSDIVFIRNGKEHSGEEAAEHLRLKLRKTNIEFETVQEFIDNLATKSSMTGNPYQVKKPDGTIMTASAWFIEFLQS